VLLNLNWVERLPIFCCLPRLTRSQQQQHQHHQTTTSVDIKVLHHNWVSTSLSNDAHISCHSFTALKTIHVNYIILNLTVTLTPFLTDFYAKSFRKCFQRKPTIYYTTYCVELNGYSHTFHHSFTVSKPIQHRLQNSRSDGITK